MNKVPKPITREDFKRYTSLSTDERIYRCSKSLIISHYKSICSSIFCRIELGHWDDYDKAIDSLIKAREERDRKLAQLEENYNGNS